MSPGAPDPDARRKSAAADAASSSSQRVPSARRTAVRNIIAKTVSVPVEKASRLLLIAVAAPALGETSFGRYQFADTVTALLVLATDLGLGIWTTRALARTPGRATVIVGTGLWVKTLAAAPYLVLVAAVALATHDRQTRYALVLLGVATLAGSFIEYCNAVFRGYERLRDEGRLNAVRSLLVTAAGLGALCWRRSVLALAVGLMAGTVAAAIYGLSTVRRHYRLLTPIDGAPLDWKLARSAVAEAFPLWMATLLSLVYFKGDAVMLRWFDGDAAVGSYSAAYKIFEATMVMPSIILAASFPAFVRLNAAGMDAGKHRRAEVMLASGLLLLGLVVAGAIYAATRPIISLVFGADFVSAGMSLRVLCLGIPLLFLNYGLTHFLIARNLERRNLVFALAMVAVNVPLNLVFIPRWGGPGAAWATLATEVALTLCCLITLGWGWRRPVSTSCDPQRSP